MEIFIARQPIFDRQQLMISYEQGEWNQFSERAAQKQIEEEKIPLYRKALEWATQRFSASQTVG